MSGDASKQRITSTAGLVDQLHGAIWWGGCAWFLLVVLVAFVAGFVLDRHLAAQAIETHLLREDQRLATALSLLLVGEVASSSTWYSWSSDIDPFDAPAGLPAGLLAQGSALSDRRPTGLVYLTDHLWFLRRDGEHVQARPCSRICLNQIAAALPGEIDMRPALTDLPDRPAAASRPLSGSFHGQLQNQGDRCIAQLDDPQGRPTAVLSWASPAPRGDWTWRLIFPALAGASLLMGFWTMHRWLSHPLSALQRSVDRYSQRPRLSHRSRPSSSGIQSVTDLASTVESTMQELNEARYELAAAKATAERTSAAKGQFLAHLSHEVRTPLNGILGMGHLLLQRELDPESQTYAETLVESGENLLHLLNDVLDLSRVEADRLELHPDTQPIVPLLQRTVAQFLGAAREKHLALSASVMPDCPSHLVVDAHRFRQVLGNLISNAINYTREGQISVRLCCELGRCLVTVTDTGVGIPADIQEHLFDAFDRGLAEEADNRSGTGLGLHLCRALSRAMGGDIRCQSDPGKGSTFEFHLPWKYQTTASIDTAGLPPNSALLVWGEPEDLLEQATELTLQRCADLAAIEAACATAYADQRAVVLIADLQRREGAIEDLRRFLQRTEHRPACLLIAPTRPRQNWLAGWPEVGCRAVPRPLPLLDCHQLTLGLWTELASRRNVRPHRLRFVAGQQVLVADDSPINRTVVIAMLRQMGLTAIEAGNGRDAVMRCLTNWPDLVLMDIRMPVQSGLEATEQIRHQLADGGPPIIGLTAEVQAERLQAARAAGMQAVITKPLRQAELAECLARFLTVETRSGPRPPSTRVLQRDSTLHRLTELADSLDQRELGELIDTSITEIDDMLARLIANADDLQTAADTAHRLKGLLLNLGLAGAAQLATTAQQVADVDRREELDRIIEQLQDVCHEIPEHLHQVLREICAQRGKSVD